LDSKPLFPEQPTIVFAGANNLRRIKCLKEVSVDAVMTSFEYIGKGHYMKKVSPTLKEWPVRTYLDSGVFTIVRKAGTTRIRIARANKDNPKTSWQELKEFADRYIEYLKVHGEFWDHIIELDVDEPEWEDEEGNKTAGLEIAMYYQKKLYEIVGPKLMPAWHVQRGHEGWRDMIAKFPYIAIGSDTAVPTSTVSTRPPMPTSIIRSMVREAHASGVGVHYLGDTRYKTFIETELDSADSTTWVSGGRFGQFPGPRGQSLRYTTKGGANADAPDTVEALTTHNGAGLARQRTDWQRTIRPIDMSRARQFRDLMTSWGIDPDKILEGSQDERLISTIKLLLLRQQEIRKARA
jgi:hypothetical protein